ncbi:MAG: two-component regulator propeller domain-containing protein [Bacteroidota bacterium]|nr:two-component regulator propeller domain-containing protein [Bacteroidota bacterium]
MRNTLPTNCRIHWMIFFFLLVAFCSQTQPVWSYESKTFLTHLTTDDGLSQNTVVSVHKDKKGQMWFGTWDGLNKYDGYHFTIYKSNSDPADDNSPLHTRVDWIQEDNYGFLWVKTYDDLLYRFDPSRDYFLRITCRKKENKEKPLERIRNVWVLRNGDVWCSLQKRGTYLVRTDPETKALTVFQPLSAAPLNRLGNLNQVFLDSKGATWLLGENGLARQLKTEDHPVMILKKALARASVPTAFYCMLETATDLYFGGSNGNLWNYDKAAHTIRPLQTGISSRIVCLRKMPDNRVMAASSDNGFFIYNPRTDQLAHYAKEHHPSMLSNRISGAYVDRYGDIWLSTDQPGVMRFQPGKAIFTHLWLRTPNEKRSGAQQTSFFMFEDVTGTLWVHTKEGMLFPFDRQNNTLKWFYNKPGSADCMFKTNIQAAWSDPQGVLWICCGNQGIYKCVRRNRDFRFTSLEPFIQSGTPDIRSLFQDPAGNLWVASKAGELRVFDRQQHSIGVLCSDGSLRASGDSKLVVYKMLKDRKGRLWLATKGQGLYLLKAKNASYRSFEIKRFVHISGNRYSLSNNNLYDLYEDRLGHIWIASYDGGLMLLSETSGQFRFLHAGNEMKQYPIESCSRVRCIEGDKKGNIWIGTTNGVLVFSDRFANVNGIHFHNFSRDEQSHNTMYNSDVYHIVCDAYGQVWIGTFGGGLMVCRHYKPGEKPQLVSYNQKNGFLTDIVLSMVEDNQHNLWLTSENTLVRFNPKTGDCDRYNVSNGLESGDFLESSVYKNAQGQLMFGNASGFYTVDPDKVARNVFAPHIVFTKFQLFGRDIAIGTKDSPLDRQVDDCPVIKLKHAQRTFNIEFAALDYQTPDNIQYMYKLEGFEDEWNSASKQRIATYTGLPKGKYTLLVKSTNSDGVWSNNVRRLEIVVLPSFGETIWAYIIYVLLAILVLAGAGYLLMFYMRLKNEVLLEQKLTDLKLRFFTDISHELRTPLTLIYAPLEHILKEEELPEAVRAQLQIVQRNVERMTRLINQILDFRKVQNKKKRLRLQESVFSDCVKKNIVNFEEIAREQNVHLQLNDESNGILVWLDRDAFDTILFNLLSNAFKFTPAEKTISVNLFTTEKEAVIQVADQGIGIEKTSQSKIFERFYSADEGNEASRRSTGIGLSLVKELAGLHGAEISVNSLLGEGTTFEVRFKLGVEHFGSEADFILDDGISAPVQTALTGQVEEENHDMMQAGREDSQMVLIVEDNEELRPFLRTVLGKKYRVAVAADGKTAWEMTQSLMPDFIITDLMLPGISGTDFIKLVKNDDSTCHIPVVVLTAKTNLETKLECLDMGADDYITKPFSATFLEARVSNMLNQRGKLQSFYRERLLVTEPKVDIAVPEPPAHSRNTEFMERLMTVMEKNISNGSFSVEQLCSMAGYGRTVFFNKLKSLTGLSPNEYIREVRIKRAAQLLEKGEYTVSQITYMVGMNDSRYFSKCFKQRYHMTPTEYREKLRQPDQAADAD